MQALRIKEVEYIPDSVFKFITIKMQNYWNVWLFLYYCICDGLRIEGKICNKK